MMCTGTPCSLQTLSCADILSDIVTGCAQERQEQFTRDKGVATLEHRGTFLQTARFGYATEGALFISVQQSTHVVSALQKVWVLI